MQHERRRQDRRSAVASRPLFNVENNVLSLVDRLTILEEVVNDGGIVPNISEGMGRAVARMISEALTEALAVEQAWRAEFGRFP